MNALVLEFIERAAAVGELLSCSAKNGVDNSAENTVDGTDGTANDAANEASGGGGSEGEERDGCEAHGSEVNVDALKVCRRGE